MKEDRKRQLRSRVMSLGGMAVFVLTLTSEDLRSIGPAPLAMLLGWSLLIAVLGSVGAAPNLKSKPGAGAAFGKALIAAGGVLALSIALWSAGAHPLELTKGIREGGWLWLQLLIILLAGGAAIKEYSRRESPPSGS